MVLGTTLDVDQSNSSDVRHKSNKTTQDARLNK